MRNFILQLQLFMLCGAGTAFAMFESENNLKQSHEIIKSRGAIQPEDEEYSDSGMSSLLEGDNTQDDVKSISDISWLSDINPPREEGTEQILYTTIDDPDQFFEKSFSNLEILDEEYQIFNLKIRKKEKRHPVLDALESLEVSNVSDIQSWMLENKGFLLGKNYIRTFLDKKEFRETSLLKLKEVVRESYQKFSNLNLDERVLKIRQEKILISLDDLNKIKEALEAPEKWEDFEREWKERDLKEIKNENEEKKVNRIFELFQKFGPLCEIIQGILRKEGFKVSLDSIRGILGIPERVDNGTKRKRNQKVLELFDQGKRTFQTMKETRIPLKSFYRLLKSKRPNVLKRRKEEAEKKKTKLTLDLYDSFNFSNKDIEFWLREAGFRFGQNFVSHTLKANNRAVRQTTREKYSPEQRQKVIKLYLSGVPIKKIEEQTEISPRTIGRYIQEYKEANGESKDMKKAKVIDLHLSAVSTEEIAKKVGVCIRTAQSYIKEYEQEQKAKVIKLYLLKGEIGDIVLQTGIPKEKVDDYIKKYEQDNKEEKEENKEQKTPITFDPKIQDFIQERKNEKGEIQESKTQLILDLYDTFRLPSANKIEFYMRNAGFKFSEGFVRCVLKDNNRAVPQATQTKYSLKQRKEVIDLHLSAVSTEEIARKTGVPILRVRDYIRKHKNKKEDSQKSEVNSSKLSGKNKNSKKIRKPRNLTE